MDAGFNDTMHVTLTAVFGVLVALAVVLSAVAYRAESGGRKGEGCRVAATQETTQAHDRGRISGSGRFVFVLDLPWPVRVFCSPPAAPRKCQAQMAYAVRRPRPSLSVRRD